MLGTHVTGLLAATCTPARIYVHTAAATAAARYRMYLKALRRRRRRCRRCRRAISTRLCLSHGSSGRG